MGQKVNPIGLRLGINRTWDSRWFAKKDYADLLHEDIRIREFLREHIAFALGRAQFHSGDQPANILITLL